MSSFNEAMTQIRELEERAMEELKEIIQVESWPWAQRHSLNVTWALHAHIHLLSFLAGVARGSLLDQHFLILQLVIQLLL